MEDKVRDSDIEIDVLCALLQCQSQEDVGNILDEYLHEKPGNTTATVPSNLKNFDLLQAYNITGLWLKL